jgi:hypothetical protein
MPKQVEPKKSKGQNKGINVKPLSPFPPSKPRITEKAIAIQEQKTLTVEASLGAVGGLITNGFKALAGLLATDQPPEVLSQVFDTLKEWSSNISDLEKNARTRLLEAIQEKGEVKTEAGSKTLEVGGWLLELRPQRGGYNAKKVEALIRAKGLEPKRYMVQEVIYKLDTELLNQAVAQAALTPAELETCKDEQTFALQRPKRV